jgi:formate C-acetyltransferase
MPDPEPYYRPSPLGPDCSTPRSARLRQRRFEIGYEKRTEPAEYTRLAEAAKGVYLEWEKVDPALARAQAIYHVASRCDIPIEEDTLLLGGENPFFFNLLLPALQADRYSRERDRAGDEPARRLRAGGIYSAPCFDGHITPGLENVLALGIAGIRRRIEGFLQGMYTAGEVDPAKKTFYEAALITCEAVSLYARRYRDEALRQAELAGDPARVKELCEAADVLDRVPDQPAATLREALQAYWIVYILVTLEMGGCMPGGGLGLGRPDQYLYPYFMRDLQAGRLDRDKALELMEHFLLCFRHVDYYTPHQVYTPGSQASLGGITPSGSDAFNDLTELILEASLRINMPAPYLSLRLYRDAPDSYWQAAAAYIASGLGFPVVNDEVLIPAMLRHGRSLGDARDYICSCCYEHTIPGREAFHPSCCFVNLPLILELALNGGHSLRTGQALGLATPPAEALHSFDELLEAFWMQIHFVFDRLVLLTNQADAIHTTYRRYPLMSLFIDDCLPQARDVCAGGARYNLTGCVVGGLPNTVNSLSAIRRWVFETGSVSVAELVTGLRANFAGYEPLRRRLLSAPRWGNDEPQVDELAARITRRLYTELEGRRNARGGRWQLGLYSFVANHWMGQAAGASADGRLAGEMLTRNLNPAWGSDRKGPTAVLRSLSHIDFSLAPDGCSLDLRFAPADFATPETRGKFIGFLKAFVALGVMQMGISVADTETLLDARAHPEKYPSLMVKVAGYSARFIDLSPQEQAELIGRSVQRL